MLELTFLCVVGGVLSHPVLSSSQICMLFSTALKLSSYALKSSASVKPGPAHSEEHERVVQLLL